MSVDRNGPGTITQLWWGKVARAGDSDSAERRARHGGTGPPRSGVAARPQTQIRSRPRLALRAGPQADSDRTWKSDSRFKFD